jgi:predicted transcriptional regulator of viral defense system
MALPRLYKDFYHKKVFTFDEVRAAYGKELTGYSLQSLIRDNLEKGHIGMVRRGLYYIIPQVPPPNGTYQVDKFLIAGKLAEDGVIGYHAAFELHGAAYSAFNTVHVLTRKLFKPSEFQGIRYQAVSNPYDVGIQTLGEVRCTDRERTVIDGVDRIKYVGGLEEYLKSVELLPYVDFNKIERYLSAYGKKALYAKVGFVLSLFEKQWSFPEQVKKRLQRKLSRMAFYLEERKNGAMLNKDWNLMVPEKLDQMLSEL